jgi:beta-glucanase (GH16 family)
LWQESFDGDSEQALDTDIWELQTGGDGWGNNQLEYNTDRIDNVRLSGNGELEIVAQREEYENNAYTSGRIRSQESFALPGSRFEAHIKLPKGQGLWPAFWLLGSSFEEEGWPFCGEVDIMEFRGENPQEFLTTVHGPGFSGGSSVGSTHDLDIDLSEDYHTYAVEIDSEYIAWYLDDERIHSITNGSLAGGEWIFDGEARMILNLAVGGNFLTDPTEDTPFPSKMSVDWIRYWQRDLIEP